MYEGGNWWEPEHNGSIEVRQWDMFVDKSKFSEEGWYFKHLKNRGTKYTTFVWERTVVGGSMLPLSMME